jgi:hypothetical protein
LLSEQVTELSARYSWLSIIAFLKKVKMGLNQKNTLISSIKIISNEWF